MRRKSLFPVAAAVLIALSYAATSHALGSPPSPQLPSDLPAAALPPVTIPDDEVVAINNGIGVLDSTGRFGVTPDSYKVARLIATTSAGRLYLIPGYNGACLASTNAVACGNPGEGDELLAILISDPMNGAAVGGGVVTAGVHSVTLRTSDGKTRRATVTTGVFGVGSSDGITIDGDLIRFTPSVN